MKIIGVMKCGMGRMKFSGKHALFFALVAYVYSTLELTVDSFCEQFHTSKPHLSPVSSLFMTRPGFCPTLT